MAIETVKLEDEKLSQSKHDYFAIWGIQYSQLWLTDQERFEEEFPCCGDESPGPGRKFTELRKITMGYQQEAPKWNFAETVADELIARSGRPENEYSELSHCWKKFFITRREGDKILVLSESQISEAFEKFGIRGVYALAVLAVAQMEIGITGPQSQKMSKELKEKMIEAADLLPFEYAIYTLVKPVDRICWSF
jgi:hypothetical protein